VSAKNILRILIIEDTPERQKILQQLYRDHAWMMVHTADRAIRLLNAYQFDIISLDYDIAGEGTGDQVAKVIRDSSSSSARVIIHSMNPCGREKILKFLPHSIVMPLSRMTKNNATFKRLRNELSRGIEFDWSFISKK